MNRIKRILRYLQYRLSREYCYDQEIKRGNVTIRGCGGLAGGDRETNYLQYQCMDCKYFSSF